MIAGGALPLGGTDAALTGGALERYLRLTTTCSSCPIFRPRFCCVLMVMASMPGAGGAGGGGAAGGWLAASLLDLLRPFLDMLKT
jgi:hypothetical protein